MQEYCKREDLLAMRDVHKFYCPDCGSLLVLKIGAIKIPHFAHRTSIDCDASEPESSLHLQGKLLLQKFFTDKNFPVEIEKYLPDIRQRADLLVNCHTAIEFQCSPISAADIARRSAAYSSLGLNIVWIDGNTKKSESRIQIIKLVEYKKEMLLSHNHSSYLLLLNPMKKNFQYFSNLFRLSGSQWIGKVGSLPVDRQTFPFATPKALAKQDFEVICTVFENEKSRYIKSQFFVKKRYQNPFWLLCYELELDRHHIPSFIGVPIYGAECFAEHPVIWQLKTFQAYRKKLSIEELLTSDKIKFQKKSTLKQAAMVLGQYWEFLTKYRAMEDDFAKCNEVLYDIYCKSVRKLRK